MSSYAYCANNPINRIDPDPDGRTIKISGSSSKQVFKELNKSTSLKLSYNNGVVSSKGIPKTFADTKLLEAINDNNITVNINATESNYVNGSYIIGGAFQGSTINPDGSVETHQTINPNMTKKIDQFYEMESGTTTLHEVLESYIGGIDNSGTGMPTTKSDSKNSDYQAYKNAHDKAKKLDTRYKETEAEIGQDGVFIIIKSYYDRVRGAQPKQELLINDLSK